MADPIRTYEELLLKAAQQMHKDKKNLPILHGQQEIIIPPNMTVENYHKMGLTQGQRVSWEAKQTHIDTLAQLFAEGYLDEEKYDNRVAWVRDAETQQQIDFVFTDLQKSLLDMKFNQYTEQWKTITPEKHLSRGWLTIPIFCLLILTFSLITQILAGEWFWVGILSFELLGTSFYILPRILKSYE